LGKGLAAVVYTLSSVPAFVLGYIVLALFFGVFKVYITTVPDAESSLGIHITYYLIPILVLSLGNGTLGEFIRFISLEAQAVNGSMFIKAVRARGAPLGIHFLKSMVLPLFNVVGTNLAVLLGGIVVVERIFNFRGLGWLSWEATLKRDFSVLMGIVLVMALLIRSFMLAGDLLATWLDPRLKS
jgi:peptide/nickel transport system permease protein